MSAPFTPAAEGGEEKISPTPCIRSVSAVVTLSEPLTLWPMPNNNNASPLMPEPATPMRWMWSGLLRSVRRWLRSVMRA